MLLTTQYLDEADQLADRIAIIDHGKVIAEGTRGELKALVGSGRAARPPARSRRSAERPARPGRRARRAGAARVRPGRAVGARHRRRAGRPAPSPSWPAPASPSPSSRSASPASTRCSSPSPATRPTTDHRGGRRMTATDRHRARPRRGDAARSALSTRARPAGPTRSARRSPSAGGRC